MRVRTISRTRTLSTTSQFSDSLSHSGRTRNESIRSYASSVDIIQAGDLVMSQEQGMSDRPDRSTIQLFCLNMIVVGIEFCYSMETALVTPLLLQMGLPKSLYSLTWIVSPTLGFFLNPVLGSFSDRCALSWGRRRPFILALCVGIIVGLTLFLNGKDLGLLVGDSTQNHLIGLVITTIGVVILDYCADSCDSPSKAYMIDVCNLPDVDRGLNIRAILGGVGAGLGFLFNSIDWKTNALGQAFGSEARVNFIFSFGVSFICFGLTLVSVKEKPLTAPMRKHSRQALASGTVPSLERSHPDQSMVSPPMPNTDGHRLMNANDIHDSLVTSIGHPQEPVSVKKLLFSVFKMPKELRWLCLNHFLGWSALLAIFLFYTDYVAETVYKGDPSAAQGTVERRLYEDGVKMGCWGMVVFSVSVIIYAILLEKLSSCMSCRTAYVWGQTVFAIGTGLMAIFTDSVYVTLALNATSGIMFATITTLPFGILADYHQIYQHLRVSEGRSQRGLGTDVACLSSVNFLAQIFVAAVLGFIVSACGSKIAVVLFASCVAFLAAMNSAIFVVYDVGKARGNDDEREPLLT